MSLLTAIIIVISFVGGTFVKNTITPSLPNQSTIITDLGNDKENEVIPQEYAIRDLSNIDDTCCGHTDTTPASIFLYEPPFQNIVLAGSTIEVQIVDDNPMYSMVEILYHWDTDQSNSSLTPEDPGEDDLIYEMTVTEEAGLHTLYIYGLDASDNWASESFTFTVVLTMDPPNIDFIAPSTSNETLTDVYVFRANVTDDLGLIHVKMQIDNGASLSMDYNATSSYYYRSYNVSMLTNGHHLLKVTAVDIDQPQHIESKNIDFIVIGGQGEAIVSNSPEWDSTLSDLPENINVYVDSGNFSSYVAEKGNIYFKVAVKDDLGIAAVDFTIYALEDFDPSTDEPDIGDARTELVESLSQSGSDGDWEIYEYTWDSNSSLDNYYVCQFIIQDTDEVANQLIINILLEVDNIVGDKTTTLGRRTPGFEIEILLFSLSSLILVVINMKRREKKNLLS
jgi:hypothetical protein